MPRRCLRPQPGLVHRGQLERATLGRRRDVPQERVLRVPRVARPCGRLRAPERCGVERAGAEQPAADDRAAERDDHGDSAWHGVECVEGNDGDGKGSGPGGYGERGHGDAHRITVKCEGRDAGGSEEVDSCSDGCCGGCLRGVVMMLVILARSA